MTAKTNIIEKAMRGCDERCIECSGEDEHGPTLGTAPRAWCDEYHAAVYHLARVAFDAGMDITEGRCTKDDCYCVCHEGRGAINRARHLSPDVIWADDNKDYK
jgi:hypothetical protein